MKKALNFILVLLFISLFVGCQKPSEPPVLSGEIETETPTQPQQTDTIEVEEDFSQIGYSAFLEILKEENFEYTEKYQEDSQFFSVPTNIIFVGEEMINVYEHENKQAVEKEAAGVSKDGNSISVEGKGGAEISWVSLPHFFKNDRLIVQYIGEDEAILKLLTETFGEQFAGYMG